MTDIKIEPQDTQVTTPTGPEAAETSIDLTMSFKGQPVDYLLILLKTTFFIIITLGLYYPWARAERLRYLLNHTKLGPHAFSFNGTGQEIALSYFKGLFVYGFLYAGMIYGSRISLESTGLGLAISFIFTSLFYGLLPLAIWGGKAYRLSRTRYRSIYFSVDRRQRKAFFKRYFLDFLFTVLSLGFYTPVMIYNLQKNLTQATRWGNVPFQYTARLSDSYWLSIRNFLLCVITFGLYLPFAFAKRFNFNANHTRVGEEALVRSQITAGDVVVLVVVPLLLTTVTLGLAYPWVTVWARQRMLQRISVIGRLDFTAVRQSKDLASADGETMSDLWGVDMSMGV